MLFFVLARELCSRQCAQLTKVLEDMEGNVVRFIGPVNTGKTTTLVEAYYLALSQNKKAYYIDLQDVANDIDYWRASVASETLTGVTQLKIGDVCLFVCIYVCLDVRMLETYGP